GSAAAWKHQESRGTEQQNRDSRADEIAAPHSSSRKIVELQHSPVYASADALAILTTRPSLTDDVQHSAAVRLLRLLRRGRPAIPGGGNRARGPPGGRRNRAGLRRRAGWADGSSRR